MSKISWQMGKLHMKGDSENHFKAQLLHLVHCWNLSQTPKETERVFVYSERKYYQESIAGRIWKGDILVADIEEWEKLDASEIYPRRLNAKEVLITHIDGEFIFLVTDGSATLSGRDNEFRELTVRRESTVRRENLSGRKGRVST